MSTTMLTLEMTESFNAAGTAASARRTICTGLGGSDKLYPSISQQFALNEINRKIVEVF